MPVILEPPSEGRDFLLIRRCTSCEALVKYFYGDIKTTREEWYDSYETIHEICCPCCGKQERVYEWEFEDEEGE